MKLTSWFIWLLPLVIVLCVVVLVGEVLGEQQRPGSVSLGHPTKGSLWAGRQLPRQGKGFLSNQARPNAGAVYGTDEVIEALVRTGADVERRAPGATLYINDISFFEGGQIPHHHSHRVGRDADLLFYQFDEHGKVAAPVCIHFDVAGKAVWDNKTPDLSTDDEQRRLDVRRNWQVVRSLIENQEAHVQRIFVSEPIRQLLLDHARAEHEPAWVIERAGDVMCEPSAPHDDHFHVRFFCTAEDYARGCRDAWPLYPWRRTELARLGLIDPQLYRVLRRPSKEAPRPPSRPPRKTPGRLWCP